MKNSIITALLDSTKIPMGQSGIARLRARFGRDTNLVSVLRGGGLVFLLGIAGYGLTYLTQIVVAQWLGQKEFGIYGYAWSWAHVLSEIATLGLADAMLRFFPQYVVHEDWARGRGLLRYGRALIISGAVAIALGVGAVVWLFGERLGHHYIVPMWLTCGAFPLLALIYTQRNMARAFSRPALAFMPRKVFSPLALLVGVLLLSASGLTPSATLMMLLVVFVLFSIVLAQAIGLRQVIPLQMKTAQPKHENRLWLRVSLPLLMTSSSRILLQQTSLLCLGAYREPEDVAVYFAAARIAALVPFILSSVNALGAPKIASLYAQNKHPELQRFITGATRWIFWPSLLLSLVLIVFGDIPLRMFGPSFVVGTTALWILVFGQFVSASAGPVGRLLSMTGHQDPAAQIDTGAAVLNILLSILLIPPFGLLGAASATTASVVIKNMTTFIVVKRLLKIHSFAFFAPRLGDRA